MKIIRIVLCLLVTLLCSPGIQANLTNTFKSVDVLYGESRESNPQMNFYLAILSPSGGVYTGKFVDPHRVPRVQDVLVSSDWNGPGTPELKIVTAGGTDHAKCTNLASNRNCDYLAFDITIEADGFGCPWMASVYSEVIDSDGIYRAPKSYSTVCPQVPVDNYNVSWDENTVKQKTALSLQSTGGIIEKTLSTYLLKDGRLCDGGQMDDRGAECRYVANLITFTALGCGDSGKVTVTPIEHPVTDKQLHDMQVRVDTSSLQPIDATCQFQYVLNVL